MAGWSKVFEMGTMEHARTYFVGPYVESWIPAWLLWTAGTAVPFIELAAGAMLVAGVHIKEAAYALGGVLVLVTYGHLLAAPLYDFSSHVIPRLFLLLVVLWVPPEVDRWKVEALWERKQ